MNLTRGYIQKILKSNLTKKNTDNYVLKKVKHTIHAIRKKSSLHNSTIFKRLQSS